MIARSLNLDFFLGNAKAFVLGYIFVGVLLFYYETALRPFKELTEYERKGIQKAMNACALRGAVVFVIVWSWYCLK